MHIRISKPEDLEEILLIYERARVFMAQHGNAEQWGNGYPPRKLVEQDMEQGNSYVCEEEARIVGTFFYRYGADPDYRRIEGGKWINSRPYGVVHRIASALGGRGVASFCLDWALNQCGNLRIDTHRDNIPMQNLLRRNGFTLCGTVRLAGGEERLAFQKEKK